MLLLYFQRIALFLSPLRPWCLGLALMGGICAGFALGGHDNAQAIGLRLSILFTLWMLMTHACIKLFQDIPSPVLPGLNWWERLRQRLHLWSYHLLALGVLVVSLSLISLTLKLWFL